MSGIGANKSCGQYLSAVYNHPPGQTRSINHPEGQFFDDAARYFDWLAGFIAASNWWMARTDTGNSVNNADYAAIDVWVRRWCEQNPTKSVVEAVSEFVIKRSQ
jgi:hypothetical protein